MKASLCTRCEPMFSTLANLTSLMSDEGYRHYRRGELEASASEGCKLCTILWSETKELWEEEDQWVAIKAKFEQQVELEVGHRQSDHDLHPFQQAADGLFISIALMSTNGWNDITPTTFLPITAADDHAARYIRNRPIPCDLSQGRSEAQIRTWLQECQKYHQCSSDKSVSQLPTRVIDISGAQPRLHTSVKGERSHYAALSYCWGGPQKVLTTIANLKSNMQGIPLDALPKTLQDAIHITKILGFQFLWIDALCIIQDSPEDKAIEINKMGSIYRDATVTIFATSASKVDEGFLQHRSPDDGVLLPFYVSEYKQGTVTLILKDDAYTPEEPLDTRGWVLQETLLSRRRLVFGTKELLWRCKKGNYRTVTASPRSYAMLMDGLPSDIFFTQGYDLETQKQADESYAKSWSVIVENFTARGITDKEDRLPAIGGVASELQKLWKDDYVVGTWRRTLPVHLAWHRLKSHPSAPLPRPLKYRAPSWSWASVDCAVAFRPIEIVEIEIIDYDVTPESPLVPFGSSAIGGKLVVKSKVLAMKDIEPELRAAWTITLDADSEVMADTDTHFALVGFQAGWATIGIILRLNTNGAFVRIGSFFYRDDVDEISMRSKRIWTRPEASTQEITIY
ncbi:heterokaryon incompatibility protein-domain-containing protein [Xylogone sp. PMI_703]|nr:heterokaryon incompatibility protein-domain-containing protein [Xylogone sp. PMI_703]